VGLPEQNPTTISGTLTNLTNVVQTATYSVIRHLMDAQVQPLDVVVSVNPKPVIPGQSSTICSGDAYGYPIKWHSDCSNNSSFKHHLYLSAPSILLQ
jgi:hypothetical protein